MSKHMLINVALVCLVSLGLSHTVLASIQTVYMCNLEKGASMDSLMKLQKNYVAELKKLKGGNKFSASISIPVAAQVEQGRSFIWIGRVPDWTTYAMISDAYEGSKSAQIAGAAFEGVTRCSSSSIWRSDEIE